MLASRWYCRRPADLALSHWPDGAVLYDEAGGQLHYLTPAAAHLLAMLCQGGSWSIEALAEALLGRDCRAEDIELVEAALVQFQALNLIEPEPH